MKFKTLKHKTLSDTFGHFIEVFSEDKSRFFGWEIGHCDIPKLQPMTATMELMLQYWEKIPNATKIPEYLKDYDLVEVEVNVV